MEGESIGNFIISLVKNRFVILKLAYGVKYDIEMYYM